MWKYRTGGVEGRKMIQQGVNFVIFSVERAVMQTTLYGNELWCLRENKIRMLMKTQRDML